MKYDLMSTTVNLLMLYPAIANSSLTVCGSFLSSSECSQEVDDVKSDKYGLTLPLLSVVTQIRGGDNYSPVGPNGSNYYPPSPHLPPPPPPPPRQSEWQEAPTTNSNYASSYPNQAAQNTSPQGAGQCLSTYPAPPDDHEVRARFLRATKGDQVEAHRRYTETMEWRRQQRMDDIINEPHPNFDIIKRNYPHYFHLRGKNNEPVYYESPPKMNLNALRSAGVTLDDMLRHFALVTEFMWTHIETSQRSKSIYIIDLEGIGLRDFVGDVVKFVKAASDFTSRHYPERSGAIFLLNVPTYFSVIWSVVKSILDPVTLKKIKILRGKENIRTALAEVIPVENIPPDYGGTSVPLGWAPEERRLEEIMVHNNNHQGEGTVSQQQQHLLYGEHSCVSQSMPPHPPVHHHNNGEQLMQQSETNQHGFHGYANAYTKQQPPPPPPPFR